MTRSLRILMTGLIDYAGLFPPAKLGMQDAVETYNRSIVGEHEWMLGRFICPVSRLGEFSHAAAALMPGTFASSGYRETTAQRPPWRVSALIDGDLLADIDRIDEFNAHHSNPDQGLARVEMIELKVAKVGEIDDALDIIPDDIVPFFEFPVSCAGGGADCRGYVAALAGTGAAAKIRTGGVVGNAFPTCAEVSAFLHACAAASVPFKATAGLHHPIRACHKLTYEPDAQSCTMHGFLNLFIAAALVNAGKIDEARTIALLQAEDASEFKFADAALTWRSWGLDSAQIALAREHFALCFGSCSFDEPLADLGTLGLL